MNGKKLYHAFAVLGIAAALGISSPGVAQTAKTAGAHFSFSGKRPTFHEDFIDKIEVVVGGANSEGRLSLIESIWTTKFAVEPHFHKLHAETFYIISGKVEWTINGETHVMGAGDLVHIPANVVHSVKVLEDMHSLMFYQAGGYENDRELEASFTAEQQKDPKVKALIRKLTDFNPASGPLVPNKVVDGQPRKGIPTFSFKDKRPGFKEGSVENIEIALSGDETEGRLVVVQSDWLPSFGAPLHYHKQHTETFYVMSGKMEWTVNGETRVLGKGDAVHIPPNVTHSVKVLEKAHTLWISDPGGLDEGFTRREGFTEAELKDPKISRLFMQLGDFHIPGMR